MNWLKRLFCGIIMVFSCMVVEMSTGMAAVQTEDISLGGIKPGMTYQDITGVYGQPTREERGYAQLLSKVIFYGDSVEIGFCGEKVLYVTVTADNGWQSPQGIHPGMDLREAVLICGQDYTSFQSPKQRPEKLKYSPYFEMRWQGTRYVYRCAAPVEVYTYAPGDTTWGISLVTKGDGAEKVEAVSIRAYMPEY